MRPLGKARTCFFRRGSDDGVGQSVGPDVRGGDRTRQDQHDGMHRGGVRGVGWVVVGEVFGVEVSHFYRRKEKSERVC